MPGIFGSSLPGPHRRGDAERVLSRMAGPLRYHARQSTQFCFLDDVSAGLVDYGGGYEFLKGALAQRDGVVAILDGEVYPELSDLAPELRRGGATVQRADYCLELYLRHGLNAIERFNGAFGLALIDTREGRIHLSTDRFGHRWLFYWSDGPASAFASSVRSLLLYRDDIGRQYDTRALAELVVFERVLGDRTLFSDVKRLPAGHRATWNGRNWEVQRYFKARLRYDRGGLKSWQEASAELVVRLRRSLQKRTADQAKTGLFLSGGLDSRLVLGCCPVPVVACTYAHPGRLPAEARVATRLAAAAGVPCLAVPRAPDYYAAISGPGAELNEGLATFVGCHSLGLHGALAQEGIRVVLTGDRSDVAFKDYFAGEMDLSDLTPWTGDVLQRRRAARKLMSSPIIRRAHRQDLMMLALNGAQKREFALTFERCLADLQDWFTTKSVEEALAVVGLADWQGLTSMGFVRGLATEFVERSPFYDNDVWDLSLAIPPAWRERARIVRRAVGLASAPLARIPDVGTGLPPVIPWPWDGYAAFVRQKVRKVAKWCSRSSRALSSLRPPAPGTSVFMWSGAHDRNAALRHCAEYRDLVVRSVADLPAEYFDLDLIHSLLEEDLAAETPRHGSLFEILITFAHFDGKWGVRASRPADGSLSRA